MTELSGYEHLHPDDRPYIGLNHVTSEQSLWELFRLERAMRVVYKLTTDPTSSELETRLQEISQLPVDR